MDACIKDFMGNEVRAGDTVVIVRPDYRDLLVTTVQKVTKTGIKAFVENYRGEKEGVYRSRGYFLKQ